MRTTLDLPLPPSVNNLYANVPKVGRVKTKRYRTWLNAAGWELKTQRPQPVVGHYTMTLLLQRPDNRRRDCSNAIKAVEDLLVTHGILSDDSLALSLTIRWEGIGRRCTVILEPVAQEARHAA